MVNKAYHRYPLKSVFTYNFITALHYVIGSSGLAFAFDFSSTGKVIATVYLSFAFFQMYLLMPIMVCPNCVYTNRPNMLCISGLNTFSRKIFPKGDTNKFDRRANGILCHNNLYLSAKVLPILIILPYLFINFSIPLLITFIIIIGLLLLRVFYIFPKIACNHCLAINICPNAISMGLNEG